MSSRQKDFLVLSISLVIPCMIFAIVIIKFNKQNEEVLAISYLGYISSTQCNMQQTAIIDQDDDREGEYMLLNEMTGAVRPRPNIDGHYLEVDPPFIDTELTAPKSISSFKGYHFQVFLPGSQKALTDDGLNPLPRESNSEIIDAQEKKYRLYAWPQENSMAKKVFFVNETREILFSDNKVDQKLLFSGEKNTPMFNSVVSSEDEKPSKFDGEIILGKQSVSGLFWNTVVNLKSD